MKRDGSGSQDRGQRTRSQVLSQQVESKIAAENMELKKKRIQQEALIDNMRSELDEKASKYLDLLKEKQQTENQLKQGKDNFAKFDDLVEARVQKLLESRNINHNELEKERDRLQGEISTLKKALKDTESQRENYRNENLKLQRDLDERRVIGGGSDDTLIAKTRIDCANKESKIQELLRDHNALSNQMAEYLQENAYLRQLANVPANFGLKREQVKLQDQRTADDFKKLIKVLQEDNFQLEAERAKLKHALRIMSIQDAFQNESDTVRERKLKEVLEQRLPRMSLDQLCKVDDYIVSLLNGFDGMEARDKLLQLQQEADKNRNQNNDQQVHGLNQKVLEALKNNKGGVDNSPLLQQLIDQNDSLKNQLERLMEAIPSQMAAANPFAGQNNDPLSKYSGSIGGYHAPQLPTVVPGSSHYHAHSQEYHQSQIHLHDQNGHDGVKDREVAWYQALLQESFETIKRKDQAVKDQNIQIQELYTKVKKQLLTQDAMYRDYAKIKKNNDELKKKFHDDTVLKDSKITELKTTNHNLNNAMNAQMGGDALKSKLVELTKENCALEVNFLQLTRKYNILEEQQRLLNDAYHAKDVNDGEKDKFLRLRIESLREWKDKAISQLSFLFNKLKNATPTSDYKILQHELELASAKLQDRVKEGAQHVLQMAKIRGHDRALFEAKVQKEEWEEKRNDYQCSIDILTKRLESLDPTFRFENKVFGEIATRINDKQISLVSAFEIFDQNKDGEMTMDEFKAALARLHINNLSMDQLRCVWNSLDTDKSGSISVSEFCKKLEFFGVRNLSTNEAILTQIITAAAKSKLTDKNDLFDLFDREQKGFVTRQDFMDIFQNLDVKIKREDLERFCDQWWSDKDAGIDYQQFLRMFKRFELRENAEKDWKARTTKVFSEETLRSKKKIFDAISKALDENNSSIKMLFRTIDKDGSMEIQKNEFFQMLENMRQKVSSRQSDEIFDSIDIDGNGSVTLAELTSEFRKVREITIEQMIEDNRMEDKLAKQANSRPVGNDDKLQLETRNDILQAKIKQLERKLRAQERVQQHADEQRKISEQQYNEVESHWNEMSKNSHELKAQIIKFEQERKNMIRRDEAENLKAVNEKQATDIVETRAAMLSYKNMTQVFADQAKNIKLMHERKRDENESLMAAMREMQAGNPNNERLGKLYSIIMLSRWQEAAVNKKYDQVLNENKELRQLLLGKDVEIERVQQQNFDIQREHQKLHEEIGQLNKEKTKQNSQYLAKSNVDFFNKVIVELGERNSDLEEKTMKLHEKATKDQASLDIAESKLQQMQKFDLKDMQGASPNDIYHRMLQQADDYKNLSLKEKQANRKAGDAQERIDYLQNLYKKNQSLLETLEMENSELQATNTKLREDFLKRDNERMQKHFSGANEWLGGSATNNKVQIRKDFDAGRYAQGDNTVTNYTANIGQGPNTGGSLGPYQGSGPNAGGGRGIDNDMMKALQEKIFKMQHRIQIQDAQIKQYENWQGMDKILTADEVLKDAIDQHQAKTMQAHDLEQKEMSDAAYQTIRTLQEMLAFKTDANSRKDEQLTNLRNEMIEKRRDDGKRIVELETQVYEATRKLSDLQAKGVFQDGRDSKKPSRDNPDRKTDKHYTDLLHEKDRLIKDLEMKLQGRMAVSHDQVGKSNKHQQEIDAIKSENKRLMSQITNSAADKARYERLVQQRKEQEKNMENLQNAISKLKEDLTSAEIQNRNNPLGGGSASLNERAKQAGDNNAIQEYKIKEGVHLRKISDLQKQVQQLQVQKASIDSELTDTKKKLAESQKNLTSATNEKNDFKGRFDQAKKDLIALQTASANVPGFMNSEELKQKIEELERESRVLKANQNPVVGYDTQRELFTSLVQPVGLELDDRNLNVQDVLHMMLKIVQKNKRISPLRAVCQSLDIHRRGELMRREFDEATQMIGIKLTNQELIKIEVACSENGSSDIVCYDHIARYLEGIPTFKFMAANPLNNIAHHLVKHDLSKEQLRQLIVGISSAQQISQEDLKKNLKCPKSGISFSEQVFAIWTFLNQDQTGTTISVERIMEEAMNVKIAILINDIYAYMQKHDNYFWNLLKKINPGKEDYLNTTQFGALMREIKYYLLEEPNNLQDLTQFFGVQNGKFPYDLLKKYFGNAFVSSAKLPDPRPMKETNQTKPSLLNEERTKKLMLTARKVLCGWEKIRTELKSDAGTEEDSDGIVSINNLRIKIELKNIKGLSSDELQELMRWANSAQRDMVCISVFAENLMKLAQEDKIDSDLRELSKKAKLQGVFIKEAFDPFVKKNKANSSTLDPNLIDKKQFKNAIQSMSLGYNDAEIDFLWKEMCKASNVENKINVVDFCSRVQKMGVTPALPQSLTRAQVPGSFGAQTTTRDRKTGDCCCPCYCS